MRKPSGLQRPAQILFILTFSYLCMAASCQGDQVKNALNITVDSMGSATGKVWDYSRDFVDSESGPALICKDIIDKYADDPRPDDIVEVEALAECKAKIDKFERDLKQALDGCASALKALEDGLEAWDAWDAEKRLQAVLEAAAGMSDLVDVLKTAGVDVPDFITEAMGYIEALSNSLKEAS